MCFKANKAIKYKIRSYTITGLWLVAVTCATYLMALWFGHLFKTKAEKLFIFLSEHHIALIIASVLAALLGFVIIYQFGRRLKHQKIRNQPSYVFFLYWGLTLLLLVTIFHCPVLTICGSILALAGISLLAVIIYWAWPPRSLNSYNRFAAGAVSRANDGLDFKESAVNVAKGLIANNQNYLSVHALYGDMGSGKSSYTRMIVEALEDDGCLGKQELLYTYISLTETNAAKDFSQLFSERWADTLAERYPFIRIGYITPLLTTIFRETNANLLSAIFSFLTIHKKGLQQTIAKTWDPNLGSAPVYTSAAVGSMFAYIPEVREKIWLIVVDEIERAQFDEIYRLVEAIERFKNEGRTGLPIRIIFILCISRTDFSRLIDAFKATDTRAFLLKKFFFEDAKSVTNTIHLPPVSYETRLKFTQDKVNTFIKMRSANIGFNIEECAPTGLEMPSREFIKEPKKVLEYVLFLLMQCPPRIVDRCLSELDFFQASYRDASGKQAFESICFADLLALSLIRIRYPYLIDFFKATLDQLLPSEDHGLANEFTRRHEFIEKKKTLWDWVGLINPDLSVTEADKSLMEELVNLVARSWIDYLDESGFRTENRLTYDKRTSDPRVMREYLSLCSNAPADHFERSKEILSKHQRSKYEFVSLTTEELLEYSRFVRDIKTLGASIYLDLVEEIAKRLREKKIPIQPCNTGSTIFDEALYQFIFQVVEVAERINLNDQSLSDEFKKLFAYWEEVLLSENVTSGGKFLILNSYFNFEDGRGSGIHVRLHHVQQLFKKHFSNEIKTIVSRVFQEMADRYLDGNDVLYEHEENFFFTLYQRWSGTLDDDEIKKIRAAAARGLEARPEVLSLYWTQYPEKEKYEEMKQFDDWFYKKGTELYMPLEKLIQLTETSPNSDEYSKEMAAFWKVAQKDDFVKRHLKLEPTSNTLYAILKRIGILT